MKKTLLYEKKLLLGCIAIVLVMVFQESRAQTPFESLNYLYSIQGSHVIGGMHNRQPNANPNSYSQQLHNITGVWPGLYSADFQFEPNEIANRQTMVNQAIQEWNNGAMINIMWHACNPAKGEPCYWDNNGVLSQMSEWEWSQLITDGTSINNSWKSRMDDIAYYLQQLEDAGVEVFFRPLHEMNQGMFWWGGRPGPNGTARLYQITHDYLTYTKGLTNLIWVWNLQDFSTLASDLNSYDPGGQYWDVLTLDMYWSDGQGYTTAKYNAMANKAGNKPMGIGECQDLPAVNLLALQPKWSFFMGWSELVFQNNSNQKIQEIYWSDRVITLNEMPGWTGNGGGSSGYHTVPGDFGAEDYSNMSGVQTEQTSDVGGGLNVSHIDAGDWMTYDVDVASSGTYTVSYRVASLNGGGTIQLEEAGGGPVYGTISVPSTGGWQNWTTISHNVQLSSGQQQLGLAIPSGGFNLNWVSIASASSSGANLAYNRPVTASSTESPHAASQAVDGDGNTRWSSLYADPQYFIVDLGANYNVNRVRIAWEAAYASYYQIQFSTDNVNWTTVRSVSGNTNLENDLTGLSGTARYVKMYGINRGTNYGYSMYEMEVYGTPAAGSFSTQNKSMLLAEEPIKKETFNAYPNPFTDQVTLLAPLGEGAFTIKVYDALGKEMVAFDGEQFEGSSSAVVLDTKGWPSGLYTCIVDCPERRWVNKLIKR